MTAFTSTSPEYDTTITELSVKRPNRHPNHMSPVQRVMYNWPVTVEDVTIINLLNRQKDNSSWCLKYTWGK